MPSVSSSARRSRNARLLLFAALGALAGTAAMASAGGTPEYVAGDLSVLPGQTLVYENRTLVVSGDVVVPAGATLELRNSTLLLNLTTNGSRQFNVESGGTFRALDLDGLPATSFDRSVVGSADPSRRFVAHFAPGANVLVRGSAISGFGYSLASPGLLIESNNVSFVDAALEAYEYLRVEAVSPSFEGTVFGGDGTGSNYFFGSQSTLSNCTLTRHFVALSGGNASALTLRGALVRDSVFAFAANGSSLTVSGSTVNNSSSGVFLTNGSSAQFFDVGFDASLVAFGDPASWLAANRLFTVKVLNGAADPVRNATVSVTSASNATLLSGNTGSSGAVGPSAILAFFMNASGRVDTPNVTATAVRGLNSSARSFSPILEPSPVALVVLSNIDPTLVLIAPAPDSILLAGSGVAFTVTVADPDDTPGGVQVTWRSSAQGPLGSGSSLMALLGAGAHTIEVEARDGEEGFRLLRFNVTAETGTPVSFSRFEGGLFYNATMWKTSRGSFALTPYDDPNAPLLSFGRAVMVHATTGELAWAFASVEVPYDPTLVPYGSNESNLTVRFWPSGASLATPGTSVSALLNVSRHLLTVNLTAAGGLGTLVVVAAPGPNLPPNVTVPPMLFAVVGQPLSFRINATDTPGQVLTYELEGGPAWLEIEATTGLLSGVPSEGDRGRAEWTVLVTDPDRAFAGVYLHVFVSGTAVNLPPQLLNVRFTPSSPIGAGDVTVEVTFFDPDGDLPFILEVIIDGDPQLMVPVVQTDINTSDGKLYAFTRAMAVGSHNISFRTSDGAPGREDFVTLAAPAFAVAPDTLRTLNNWFLALFVSMALTLALYLYFKTRKPAKAPPAAPLLPDDRATFLEGDALKRIPEQPRIVKPKEDREAELASEAGVAAGVADRASKRAKAKLKPAKEEE